MLGRDALASPAALPPDVASFCGVSSFYNTAHSFLVLEPIKPSHLGGGGEDVGGINNYSAMFKYRSPLLLMGFLRNIGKRLQKTGRRLCLHRGPREGGLAANGS